MSSKLSTAGDVLDVAVIGAGFSGLAAARALSQAGLRRIAVLEARDRVGGRVLNGVVAGHTVEMGAAWVGPGQSAVIDLAGELGLGLRPQFNRGDTFVVVDGDPMRVPTTTSPMTNEGFVGDLDRLAKTVPVEAPWTAPRAEEWDAMTFADHLSDAELSDDDRATIELMSYLTYGAAPEELSLLHVLPTSMPPAATTGSKRPRAAHRRAGSPAARRRWRWRWPPSSATSSASPHRFTRFADGTTRVRSRSTRKPG